MSRRNLNDLSNLSMLELFRAEAETQASLLNTGLLEIERGNCTPQQLEILMRAAHSFKGAAKIVNLQLLVGVAHALEDCFVAAQQDCLKLGKTETDVLLRGVDLMTKIARCPESETHAWESQHASEVALYLKKLSEILPTPQALEEPLQLAPSIPGPGPSIAAAGTELVPAQKQSALPEVRSTRQVSRSQPDLPPARIEDHERFVRLTPENLNRLLGLAGESLVESRWLRPFADSLQRLKRQHTDLGRKLESLHQSLPLDESAEVLAGQIQEARTALAESQHFLAARMEELDLYDRRSAQLSHRLYLEVLRTRMRPFGDGTRRLPRMVRDLARSLGKEVRLQVSGEQAQVDRDILEKLETPVAHLLRNAVDHGCETPAERKKAGKSFEALITLDARHSAGMLVITVSDDGAGVDFNRLREAIVSRNLAGSALAEKLSEAELLEFLFVPGFTLKKTVTEISGRGVGLDIVQNMVKGVRGAIRIHSQPGLGLKLELHLPLTLSVLRALLVDIGGEPYAFPLTQIVRTARVARESIQTLEGRHFFADGDQQVGLLTAHQVLECGAPFVNGEELAVVVLGDRNIHYGVVVDRFLGERELVVQPMDPRLGKLQDVAAAALMEDGSPVLILDIDDLLRSIEKLIASGQLTGMNQPALTAPVKRMKRVLAIDDSLTVRELERKLLTGRGYVTDVAVDGMDGWNAVRNGQYDLVVTDVDMPRMDGIELASLIKRDPRLKSVPVMIVSYKDQEQDRLRGLDAGADYYLTKGSFDHEGLLQAVADLIGEPEA